VDKILFNGIDITRSFTKFSDLAPNLGRIKLVRDDETEVDEAVLRWEKTDTDGVYKIYTSNFVMELDIKEYPEFDSIVNRSNDNYF